ncbi:S1C family serine protease [Paenibacillus abyssi]|uniref:Peptidase S1 n=1 Tax=Paenibacillus abyssi TaxID=1340531 RepID=A0A917FYP4_9BACL|nr:trypsin-like peptidase domain-containing protein [Paenibacillus abyssi]GGG14459.1 peptidase S1 [Paenibacillus abyssi]
MTKDNYETNREIDVISARSGDIHETQPGNEIRYQKQKRGLPRGLLPAFLAGALVVGGLMMASDKMNVFGSEPVVYDQSGADAMKTASLNLSSDGTSSISDIVKQTSPAVVKIETKIKASGNAMSSPFFGQPSDNGQSGELQDSGIGTGFIYDASGYILTNEHVIHGADQIDVTIQGYDEPFIATLVGSSYDMDLAVLKIEGDSPFPAIALGDSDNTQIGEWVIAIGNPYDLDYTVTTGVVSANERSISIPDEQGTRNYQHLFQTDTAINPGNSGGPLLNMNGEVIGINTAVSSDTQGIGFAIPSSTVKAVMEALMNNETIPSPYIGIGLQDISDNMLGELKLDNTDGVLVAGVQANSPAYSSSLRQYDVIVAVNNKEIANAEQFTAIIQSSKVGDQLALSIIRDGVKQEVTVTVGDKNGTRNG